VLITLYVSLLFLALYLIGILAQKYLFLREKKSMELEGKQGGRVVARVEELQPGSVKKFRLICQKYRVDCFLVNYRGKFHAYVNRCRHMTTPLDFVRYQFLTEDGRHLVCMTHGALYEPETGLCVDGPCKGLFLYQLPVHVDGGEVLVACPSGDLSFLAE